MTSSAGETGSSPRPSYDAASCSARCTVAVGSCSPGPRAPARPAPRTAPSSGARRTAAARRAAAANHPARPAPPTPGSDSARNLAPANTVGCPARSCSVDTTSGAASGVGHPAGITDHVRAGRLRRRHGGRVRTAVRHDDGRRTGGTTHRRSVARVRCVSVRQVGCSDRLGRPRAGTSPRRAARAPRHGRVPREEPSSPGVPLAPPLDGRPTASPAVARAARRAALAAVADRALVARGRHDRAPCVREERGAAHLDGPGRGVVGRRDPHGVGGGRVARSPSGLLRPPCTGGTSRSPETTSASRGRRGRPERIGPP